MASPTIPRMRLPLLAARMGMFALLGMAACKAPRTGEAPKQDDEDSGAVGLFSTPLKNDPDHPGVYETETPRQANPEDEESPEDERDGEWFIAPIPAYDPQTEYGLTVLGGYIFSLDAEDEDTPPSIVSIGGMGTTNDSGGAFGAFKGYLPGDRWRVLAVAGSVGMNYDFYGVGQGEQDQSVAVRTEADFVAAEVLKKIGPALYFGPSLTQLRTSSSIREAGALPPELDPGELRLKDLALGLHLQRDTRDDVFYPRSGSLLDPEAKFYSADWGSDLDFQIYELPFSAYHSLDEQSVLAWQVTYEQAAGDAPFYQLPSWEGRGYERGRYRNDVVLGAQAEYRRSLSKRFGGVLFGGLGNAAPSLVELDDGILLPSAGLGLRIKLTEKNQLEYRIDVAWGRDGPYFYLSVGQAF